MAKGRCVNITLCSKAKNKEIQEADIANFVCAECGKPLMKVNVTPPPPPGSWWKRHGKQVMIGAAAVAIIGIAIIFQMKKEEFTIVPPTNISLSKDRSKIFVGETDTLQAILSPEGATAQLKWATSDTTIIKVVDGVVTAVSHGKAKVGVQVVENKQLKAFCEYTVKENVPNATVSIVPLASTSLKVGGNIKLSAKVTPEGSTVSWTSSDESIASVSADGKITALKAGNVEITVQNGDAKDAVKIEVKDNGGGVNLGYGTYTGQIRNGKPEGQGRIVYTKAHRIAKYDIQGRVAQPGESVSGVFHDGEITIGKHFDAYGNFIESLNIGSAD